MAIYTKYGEKLVNESLRVDAGCMSNDKVVKVWAVVEGETAEKLYWISDVIGDNKREVQNVIQANLKKGR